MSAATAALDRLKMVQARELAVRRRDYAEVSNWDKQLADEISTVRVGGNELIIKIGLERIGRSRYALRVEILSSSDAASVNGDQQGDASSVRPAELGGDDCGVGDPTLNDEWDPRGDGSEVRVVAVEHGDERPM